MTVHLPIDELRDVLALLEADLEQQRRGTALYTRYNLACVHMRDLIQSLEWAPKDRPEKVADS